LWAWIVIFADVFGSFGRDFTDNKIA